VRAVALDVHRDSCEVAIVEEGRLRSAGRIQTRPETLELFAQSLDPGDWVTLEVTGNAWSDATSSPDGPSPRGSGASPRARRRSAASRGMKLRPEGLVRAAA